MLTSAFGDLVDNDGLRAAVDRLVGLHGEFLAICREVASVVAPCHRAIEGVVFPPKDVVTVLPKARPAISEER